jgi:DNA-binding transcriptional MerR regulator
LSEGSAPKLVPTSTAASAFGLQAHTLHEWANKGGVRCAATDEDGHRLWDLNDLRAQVVAYLKEHGGSLQDIADESQP